MKWLLLLQVSIRGTVVAAESRQPLAFSIVTLTPTNQKQFTDSAGAFAFSSIAAGPYLLSVRQIAYAPLDTQVVIGDTATTIHLALRHLAIELPPVTVAGRQCTSPGRPESSDGALAAMFDQLQENARRYELLADSYPFRYQLERTVREVNQRGDTGRPAVTTTWFSSSDDHPYRVGRVVEPGWGPWGDTVLVIHTGHLRHFGNAEFAANHCFRLAGRDTIAGETLIRIDFEPAIRIRSADMAGAAYLDSLTYELRYTETRLTRPERSALTGVRSITSRTHFRTIAPGVPLEHSEINVTTYRYNRTVRIETHRVLDVRFRRQP